MLDALPDELREVEFMSDGRPRGDIVGIVSYSDAEIRNHGIKGFVNSSEWDPAWAAGQFREIGAVKQAEWIERGIAIPKRLNAEGDERYELAGLEEMDILMHDYLAARGEVTHFLAEYVRQHPDRYLAQ